MNYEYKRASGRSQAAEAIGGSGLFSPKNMSAAQTPGCFAADAKTPPVAFDAPIFRRAMD